MATEGPNNPGTYVSDSTVGTVAWTSLSDVVSSNNVYASAEIENLTSEYLKVTNFGFAIPSGATIDGIEVFIERRDANAVGMTHNAARIVKGGTISTTDRTVTWPFSEAIQTVGTSSDLWGETWTDTDINASTFGFVVSATGGNNSGELAPADVDHIQITVHYTGDPSGDVAQTLPTLIQTATVAVDVDGTAAQTLPSLTQAAVETTTAAVTAAQALPSLTQAATETTTAVVTAAQALPSLTQAVIGEVPKSDAAQILPSLIQVASGDISISGTVAQALPSLTQSAATTSTTFVTVAQVLPSLAQDAAIYTINFVIQTFPSLTQTVAAIVDVDGDVAQTLPSLTQDIAGKSPFATAGNIDFTKFELSGAGVFIPLISIDTGFSFKKFEMAGEGVTFFPEFIQDLSEVYNLNRNRVLIPRWDWDSNGILGCSNPLTPFRCITTSEEFGLSKQLDPLREDIPPKFPESSILLQSVEELRAEALRAERAQTNAEIRLSNRLADPNYIEPQTSFPELVEKRLSLTTGELIEEAAKAERAKINAENRQLNRLNNQSIAIDTVAVAAAVDIKKKEVADAIVKKKEAVANVKKIEKYVPVVSTHVDILKGRRRRKRH